jgi:hypothetical protein
VEDILTKSDYRHERLKYPEMKDLHFIQMLEVLVDIRDVLMKLNNHIAYFEEENVREKNRRPRGPM